MSLVTPDMGLLFWTGIVFCLLMFLLVKFAWKPILGAVNAREEKISEALELAEKTKEEMKVLQASNENLLKEARAERDSMIMDAKEIATKMVEEAKESAKVEAEKIMTSTREMINAEKSAAVSELKTQVAGFAIEIAEKVVRGELSSDANQKALADKLVEDINLN